MAAPNTDEMEAFQRLSDQYQPDLPGPLISNRQPISELVTEYSQADPRFVAKTTMLAGTHGSYRKVKGDGQCGWRGCTFGYFETILLAGDIDLVVQEETRIRSFEDTMKMAGFDYELMVDMFDHTWELFDAVRKAVENEVRDDNVLLDVFNDDNKSNSVVYHFKMMTSSYMQLHPDAYEPFLEMPIHEYRISRIDPTNQEIDQIGLQALTDGVIASAGIAVEVLYLDRSMGDEVTPYSFVPDSQGWPVIRLLYRPGHYDLIYKGERPLKVFHARDVQHPIIREVQMDSGDLDLNAFMFPETATQYGQPTSHQSSGPQYYSSPSQHGQYQVPTYIPDEVYHPQQTYTPPIPHQQSMSPQTHLPPSPVPPSPQATGCPASGEPQIRWSENTYKYRIDKQKSIPLDPGTFGSSTLSKANFTNSEFQPEIWTRNEYRRH